MEVGTAPESKIQIYTPKTDNKEVNNPKVTPIKQQLISYQYHISEALTIPKMSSVLIPIIQGTIEGNREYFWNTSESTPILFLKITNNQELAWAPGSVVYWEKAQFTSEGKIEFTPTNEEARIKIGYTSDLNIAKEQEKLNKEEEPNEDFSRKYLTKFKAENRRNEPVILWINDKAPESTRPEIINATHNPKKDLEDNFIWLITLIPKEKKEIRLIYAYK